MFIFDKESSTKSAPDADAKKFVIAMGLNDYRGQSNDLRGCVNDAVGWSKLFEKHGYTSELLVDSECTINAAVSSLKKLVVLSHTYTSDFRGVISFSGHGTHMPDRNGDEIDGRDEAWCMYDGLLSDDVLRRELDRVHPAATLFVISDSCHSGTVTRSFLQAVDSGDYVKARYRPPEDDFVAALSLPVTKSILSKNETDKMNEVLLTGCLATEYSYDAHIGGKFQGAMSYNAQKILKSNPNISFQELHAAIKRSLPSRQYPQTPQLEGKVENLNKKVF